MMKMCIFIFNAIVKFIETQNFGMYPQNLNLYFDPSVSTCESRSGSSKN